MIDSFFGPTDQPESGLLTTDARPTPAVVFPFEMMTIGGPYIGTLDDLRELLALVQARLQPARAQSPIAQASQKGDPGFNPAGNLPNVG